MPVFYTVTWRQLHGFQTETYPTLYEVAIGIQITLQLVQSIFGSCVIVLEMFTWYIYVEGNQFKAIDTDILVLDNTKKKIIAQ